MRYTIKPKLIEVCRGSGPRRRVLATVPVGKKQDGTLDIDGARKKADEVLANRFDGRGYWVELMDVQATMDGRPGFMGTLVEFWRGLWQSLRLHG